VTGPQEVHFGVGRVRLAGDLLARDGARSVFLVTGMGSFTRSGAAEALAPALRELRVEHFAGVRPNPELGQVEEAVERLEQRPCDAVLGVGGGSVLDVAKLAAVLAAQPRRVPEYVAAGRGLDRPRACRLLLVPTTAGSGSEATRFATVYVDRRKRSLDHPALRADAVIVDPGLTRSQPPAVAAASGLDALSQAVESLWSPHSTGESRHLAGRALDLLVAHLPAGGRAAPDCRGSAPLALAALLAGQAIDLTRTTAAHAFAYPLTARFGVPHGHACALNLAWLLPFNWLVGEADVTDRRGDGFVRARLAEVVRKLGATDGEGAGRALLARVAALGLVPALGPLGVREGDLDWIVGEGLASDRAANNPRRLSATAACEGLRDMLRCA